ncbi:MAG: hypothetical protein IPN85_05170 [Flavobacteriales bacterium]|nr:hypothetical protein [Flavobacteriales bacterium]
MELYDIAFGARVKHPTLGLGVIYDIDVRTVYVFFKEHGEEAISRSFEGLQVIGPGPEIPGAELDIDSVKDALRDVLEEMQQPQRPVEMARKFYGGSLELKPKDASLKSKEVPIDDFFHKIVMIRDRFRVLEQKPPPRGPPPPGPCSPPAPPSAGLGRAPIPPSIARLTCSPGER